MTLTRDSILVVAITAALVAGAGLDATLTAAPESVPAVSGPRFVERASFCPPSLKSKDAVSRVAVTGTSGTAFPVGLDPDLAGDRFELSADDMVLHPREGSSGLNVVGYGGATAASALTGVRSPITGVGAAGCAATPSSVWYFAEGASTLGSDQRLLIYNPFPDEAVVRVTFFTKSGPKNKANLQDVAVPAHSSKGIAVNDFVGINRTLGARVEAVRGRFVAWRILLAKPESRPRGVQFGAGATAPALTWYFPDGGVGDGFEQRISVVNPSEDEEAIVSVTLTTRDEAIQPRRLIEVKVAPGSVKPLPLADLVGDRGDLGGVSAVVHSGNGVPVVAERVIWFDTDEVEGVASEIGSPVTATRWTLAPATAAPATDVVYVMNPSSQDSRLDITLVREEGSVLSPEALAGIRLRAGSRVKIPLGDYTSGTAMVVVLRATTAVVAERFSYSAALEDVAAVMGIPLTPSGP